MADPTSAGGHQAAIPPRTGRFGDDKDPNVGKDTQFKPGQSGNPAGQKKGKSLSRQIQEMLNDEAFIDKLNDKIAEKVKQADPEFQGTPMKAIITTAIIEAISPSLDAAARNKAREWLGRFGYGTKVDVTSGGRRIEQAPLVVSAFAPREPDAQSQAEAG